MAFLKSGLSTVAILVAALVASLLSWSFSSSSSSSSSLFVEGFQFAAIGGMHARRIGTRRLTSTTGTLLRALTPDDLEAIRKLMKTETDGLKKEMKTETNGLRTLIEEKDADTRTLMKTETDGLKKEMKTETDGLRTLIEEKDADTRTLMKNETDGLRTLIQGLSDDIADIRGRLAEDAVSKSVAARYGPVFVRPLRATSISDLTSALVPTLLKNLCVRQPDDMIVQHLLPLVQPCAFAVLQSLKHSLAATATIYREDTSKSQQNRESFSSEWERAFGSGTPSDPSDNDSWYKLFVSAGSVIGRLRLPRQDFRRDVVDSFKSYFDESSQYDLKSPHGPGILVACLVAAQSRSIAEEHYSHLKLLQEANPKGEQKSLRQMDLDAKDRVFSWCYNAAASRGKLVSDLESRNDLFEGKRKIYRHLQSDMRGIVEWTGEEIVMRAGEVKYSSNEDAMKQLVQRIDVTHMMMVMIMTELQGMRLSDTSAGQSGVAVDVHRAIFKRHGMYVVLKKRGDDEEENLQNVDGAIETQVTKLVV